MNYPQLIGGPNRFGNHLIKSCNEKLFCKGGAEGVCLFAHLKKEIVGIVEVIKTAFTDPTDKTKKFVAVKVKFKNKLKTPVSLENIKKIKELKDLPLIRQSRLSVMQIDTKSWKIILKMGSIS